jgi:antitoxin MazE
MNMHVRRWGNSAAVRLPAAALSGAGLKIDDAVRIVEENGRIVIEAIAPAPLTLDWLLADMTPEQRHEETDFGAAQGNEIW